MQILDPFGITCHDTAEDVSYVPGLINGLDDGCYQFHLVHMEIAMASWMEKVVDCCISTRAEVHDQQMLFFHPL